MSKPAREVEVKFLVSDPASFRAKLASLGAKYEGRFAEQNYFCDDPAATLRSSERMLRLRRYTALTDAGTGATEDSITYKEPVVSDAADDSRFKIRTEIETRVADLYALRQILERLGFDCWKGYSKDREMWQLSDVLVTLDALSFGWFTELEGTPEAIAALAAQLGFDLSKGVTKSYLTLAEEAS